MARQQTSFSNKGRLETPPEHSQRVQAQMDHDSWQGIDSVGCYYPEPAEVIELDAPERTVVFKRKDGF